MELPTGKVLILASASPRRREILARTGMDFEVIPGDYEEALETGAEPKALAMTLSAGKALAVARGRRSALVVGADTFIIFGREYMGKPHTPERAAAMLHRLSGRSHSVITGFTVIDADSGRRISDAVETKVWFKTLSGGDIDSYVASGEPLDKAGAYAIQGIGGALIDRIEGDYLNVVGLPLFAVCAALRSFGLAAPPVFPVQWQRDH
jgi:septum formation protein